MLALERKKLERILFYLTVFSITILLGKHFWPNYSFVEGIRIDYLSPTFYLSDLFILSLFLLTIIFRAKALFSWFSKEPLLLFLLISIFLSSLVAKNQNSAFTANLRIIEMLFLGWYASQFKIFYRKLTTIIDIILIAGVIQGVIAVVQFALQSSINGPLYYLGERSFNISTIGIATFFSNGKELLRPYGTFPHPNVLAFYLSIALVLGTSYVLRQGKNLRLYLYTPSLLLISVALFLTASRLIIIMTFISILVLLVRLKKLAFLISPALIFVLGIYFLVFSGRFGFDSVLSAIHVRMQLIDAFFMIFYENILLGVGAGNAFFHQTNLATLPPFVRFQPVHNIYFYALVQFGLMGGIAIFAFIYKTFYRILYLINIIRTRELKSLFILGVVLLGIELFLVGMFDHFPVTLQQGQLMTALLIGLIWNKTIEGYPQD